MYSDKIAMVDIEDVRKEFNAEAALLLLCCRVFLQRETKEKIQPYLKSNSIQWDKLYQLAAAHRIRPIVNNILNDCSDVDTSFKDRLKAFCFKHALKSFRCMQQAESMTQLLGGHNVPVRLYKGVDLALTVYGDSAIREFGDIDFVVDQKDIPVIAAVLKKEGFVMEGSFLYDRNPLKYIKCQKDIIYFIDIDNGGFLYEFHYKPLSSYLDMKLSFPDLFQGDPLQKDNIDACAYRNIMTINHGVVDLYANFRAAVDLAALTQQCDNNATLLKSLSGYYMLNDYILMKLFGITGNTSARPIDAMIQRTGDRVISRLCKRDVNQRIKTISILSVAFHFRKGIIPKCKLVSAVVKYFFTPIHTDTAVYKFSSPWQYYLLRPFRLINHFRRHI